MEKTINQTWNFDLEAAEGKGWVLLAGINKADGSKWVMEANRYDGKWHNAADLEELVTDNIEIRAWASVNFPF